MGIYLNPKNGSFRECVEKEIYVDKSLFIEKLWRNAKKFNKYVCVSRPRRFGKSTDAGMLAAFFSRGCDSGALFQKLKISGWEGYGKNLNSHNVICLDMQTFLSVARGVEEMVQRINERVLRELRRAFPDCNEETVLCDALSVLYAEREESFIFIIDEWDCVFREYKDDREAQKRYLDYLRLLLKDRPYVEFAYMTGILPIKKYGTHSALNMFDEISMLDAKGYTEFMGFTDCEVRELCGRYGADYSEMSQWYDGYRMQDGVSTYSPRSVVASIANRDIANYWSQTETYEALRVYIDLNYDGLKDAVIGLLAGRNVQINAASFQNDMSSFASRDDVLTLLVHLGYLCYMRDKKEVCIPNNEVKDTFILSVQNSNWDYAAEVFKNSNDLLEATWDMDAGKVASYIQNSHYETSVLQYNDENALSYTVSLAYIAAKEYYTVVREFPGGKGFADLAFIPRRNDRPAMLVELKYDKSADAGIRQIREKRYFLGLENYLDNLLLVSVNYDRETKEHTCAIERYDGSGKTVH